MGTSKFKVTSENINEFYGNATTEEIAEKQRVGWTIDEVSNLAYGWGRTIETVLCQMEEIR